ncbi:MAG TPA: hypothetical protein VHR18_02145 [Solirubrobacterales bacterium]|jgi:uncharacterized protein YcfJ|nr:hypothetical protein [Solirubrobacterales bacterium]
MSIKQKVARKAVKKTAKHTTRGAVSKLKRDPMRSTTLLGLGAVIGALAGWLLGRSTGGADPAPVQ